MRGRAAIANAQLAYQRYEEMLATDRWKALRRAGARPQGPLWASTRVKDPAYGGTRYVTGLVAPDVVNTMNAVADHGDIPDNAIHGSYAHSQTVLDELASLGIDYDGVVQTHENHRMSGVQSPVGGVNGNRADLIPDIEPRRRVVLHPEVITRAAR